MAFLDGFTFDLTGDNFIDVATSGAAWALGESRTISWALADGLIFGADDSSAYYEIWPDPSFAYGWMDEALSAFEPFIDVEFEFVGYFWDKFDAADAGSDITFSIDTSPGALSWASTFFPLPYSFYSEFSNSYFGIAGDISVNPDAGIFPDPSFQPGSQSFSAILRAIGSALGLKSLSAPGPGLGELSPRPAIEDLETNEILDIDWYTVMTVKDGNLLEAERWNPATPMMLDILSLQYLYGPNLDTNVGDTVHPLLSRDYYYSLWDAEGVDWVDASGQSKAWEIRLPSEQPSTLVDTRSGWAVPKAQSNPEDFKPIELVWLLGDIENVIGSEFSDIILGNGLSNVIEAGGGHDEIFGGFGNDLINGGVGLDVAIYEGNQASYTLTLSPTGNSVKDRRTDGNGTDTLVDVEFLDFDTDLLGGPFDLQKFGGPAELDPAELESFVELYIAYFNRAPDAVGLHFWGTAFANGTALSEMATLFIDQDETRESYPEGTTNNAFAVSVYSNVLGRTPDQIGIDFWVGLLDNGDVSRDQFILEVLRGAKSDLKPELGQDFVDQQIADQQFLSTKADIGAYFAVHKGMSDTDNASAAMALFDGTPESTTSAVNAIDDFYADALDAIDGEFLMPLVGVLDDPFAIA
ncbi:DUF4214 domain-containing protein [Sulfitobacter mediterraneus]|uniref:DUF4214 domain-containing protein n=1 Tax=Sulfitobacter mediterraneus TaxID=83219 RepID=UPI000EA2ED13|nr:DUF4214 domain-containing protein [Sulfitobacter mediterraneus]